MDLGQEIVSSALREGTLQPFLAAGITTTWLSNQEDPTPAVIFQGQHREAYQSLLKHWDRHGKVMSVDLFRLSYPETAYRLSDNNHTPEELLEIFREDRRKYLTTMASTDILEVYKEERYDEAMQLLAAHEAAMAALKGAADKPYRMVTLAELDALPELPCLIEGVVDHGTVTMLAGSFATGKSFLALDWALCLASGTPWMGHEVRQSRVLYISAEGAYGQSKRVRAWKELNPEADPDDNFSMIIDPVQFGQPDQVQLIINDAKGYDVIIIDTLARCTVGMKESSPEEMGVFVHELYKVRDSREECGTSVIVVHHTGHDKSRARGASSLPAGFDNAFLTESDDPHTLITLKSVKRKDGPPPSPMHMKLIESANSVVLESVDEVFAEANSHGDRSKQIIDYLAEHPMANQQEIAIALVEKQPTISRTLKILVDNGKVAEKAQGRSKHYYLPSA